jgi:hypothetical protein
VKKDLTHSFFAVGGVGSDRLDKDNPALEIMAGVLRGRLNQLLNGNVDSLSASWTPALGHPGLFRSDRRHRQPVSHAQSAPHGLRRAE